jgi:DNA-directed RNA polymerase subunit M/transcription elongation factor TFIIS
MSMEFCPSCKKILKIAKKAKSPVLICPKCGYQTIFRPKKSVTKKAPIFTLPVVQAVCPACGQNKSETWVIAVGSEGRTSSLTFLKCISCGFTTREAN